jgi:hypothetical protein
MPSEYAAVAGYRITVREGAKVRREAAPDLPEALELLERRARDLAGGAPARAVGGTLLRRFEPVQQVVGRVELRGPSRLRAGVDVRGDGSAEAYTGRVRRTLVPQIRGETPYDALRRVLIG